MRQLHLILSSASGFGSRWTGWILTARGSSCFPEYGHGVSVLTSSDTFQKWDGWVEDCMREIAVGYCSTAAAELLLRLGWKGDGLADSQKVEGTVQGIAARMGRSSWARRTSDRSPMSERRHLRLPRTVGYLASGCREKLRFATDFAVGPCLGWTCDVRVEIEAPERGKMRVAGLHCRLG